MGFVCRGVPAFACVFECLRDRCGGSAAVALRPGVGDGSGGEVDAAAERLVDAAEVEHQHAVEEHPYVIVAGEAEHHVLIVDFAVFGHVEVGAQIHAERISVVIRIVAEWREARRGAAGRARLGTQRKGFGGFVVGRVLRGCVETVVALIVERQQSAVRRVVGDRRILGASEQVVQRTVAVGHRRISVSAQRRVHYSRVGALALTHITVVVGLRRAADVFEFQRMVVVDRVALVIMQAHVDAGLLFHGSRRGCFFAVFRQCGRRGGVAHAAKHGDCRKRGDNLSGEMPRHPPFVVTCMLHLRSSPYAASNNAAIPLTRTGKSRARRAHMVLPMLQL